MAMEKGSMQSNLDCFLNCTTPLVPSQFLAKSEIRNLNRLWHPWEREKVEYFKLADLWNCFDEWSAYGAGIPIRLDTGETLVQYYVPYLSAIQIFTSTSPANFLRYTPFVYILVLSQFDHNTRVWLLFGGEGVVASLNVFLRIGKLDHERSQVGPRGFI
uniref:Putative ovule protein n=1 Tax=Solanum chacoense TaxID=4108 RepID=A0A0V0HX82_SOLCH